MDLRFLIPLSVLLVLVASEPGFVSNSLLWKRLGLNRDIGDNGPKISSQKKKGESTVYFIKLPPQPYFYIPTQFAVPNGLAQTKQNPFQVVPLDFTSNGRPDNVYHWNLPLGFSPTSTTPSTTTTATTTTTTTTVRPPKKSETFKKNYLNNGKPQKLFLLENSYLKPLYYY